MKRFLRIVDGISKGFGELCFWLTLVLLVLVFGGAVSRYVFNAPIKWVPELSQFVFGASFMLAGAVTLMWNGHVRIDALVDRLSPRAQAILELVVSVFFWLFCGTLLYQGGIMAWESVEVWETSGTFWDPPVWPIKVVVPLSVILLMLQGVAKFIRDWHVATTGKEIE